MPDIREITPAELQKMRDEGVTLLDVREPWETEICRIEGSVLIPMNSLPARLAEIPIDSPVAVICHAGMRSYTVAAWLISQGYSACSLAGGIHRWAVEVDAGMARY